MYHNPLLEEQHSRLILVLKQAIVSEFNSGDWRELGYLTSCSQVINGHPRLLRSLSWGDDDYDGNVFVVLERLLEASSSNKEKILGVEKIQHWIKKNNPEAYRDLYPDGVFVTEFAPKQNSPRQIVETALRDAETLISSSGPVSAVDRSHTALHGYLITLCDKYSIAYNSDPSVTELYKLLRQNVPVLKKIGAQDGEINKIIKAFSTILDALNPIRNRGSIAHPNEQLIGEPEAILAINAVRTILHYLDTKL